MSSKAKEPKETKDSKGSEVPILAKKHGVYCRFKDSLRKCLGEGNVPDNAQLVQWIKYCRQLETNNYVTDVEGIIYVPRTMGGVLRWFMRLVFHDDELEAKFDQPDVFEKEYAEIRKRDMAKQTMVARGTSTESIKEKVCGYFVIAMLATNAAVNRLNRVLAYDIARTPLKLELYPESSAQDVDIKQGGCLSDKYGMYSQEVRTAYPPHQVKVNSTKNDGIFMSCPVVPISKHGVSVISDIDDTVRDTGVLESPDKQIENILFKTYGESGIPGVPEWYQTMNKQYHVPVHYVSNGPWQLYNMVQNFLIFQKLPIASVHLKEYAPPFKFYNVGEIVRKLWTVCTMSAAKRKRATLTQIMADFPERKFVLIGDSGEYDLEAYSFLADKYPDQILAIYIRAVPNSFSSKKRDDDVRAAIQEKLDSRSQKAQEKFQQASVPAKIVTRIRRRTSSMSIHLPFTHVLPTPVEKPVECPPAKASTDALRLSTISSDPPDSKDSKSSKTSAPDSPVSPTGFDPVAWIKQDRRMRRWRPRIEEALEKIPARIPVKFWTCPDDVKEDCFRIIEKAQA